MKGFTDGIRRQFFDFDPGGTSKSVCSNFMIALII